MVPASKQPLYLNSQNLSAMLLKVITSINGIFLIFNIQAKQQGVLYFVIFNIQVDQHLHTIFSM